MVCLVNGGIGVQTGIHHDPVDVDDASPLQSRSEAGILLNNLLRFFILSHEDQRLGSRAPFPAGNPAGHEINYGLIS